MKWGQQYHNSNTSKAPNMYVRFNNRQMIRWSMVLAAMHRGKYPSLSWHQFHLSQQSQSQNLVSVSPPLQNPPCSSANNCLPSTISTNLSWTTEHITLYITGANVIPQKLSTSKIPMLFFLGTGTTIPLHENGTRHVSNIGWPTFTTSLPRFPCRPSCPLAQHWEAWAGGDPFSVGGVLRHLWEWWLRAPQEEQAWRCRHVSGKRQEPEFQGSHVLLLGWEGRYLGAVQSHSRMRVDPSRQARPLPKNMQMSGGPSYNKLAHRVPAGRASDKTSAKCTGCHLHLSIPWKQRRMGHYELSVLKLTVVACL